MNAEPAGYMALRSTTTAKSGDYDNLNKGRQGHGYDVPKGSLVGYEVPKNQTNRRNPGNELIFLWEPLISQFPWVFILRKIVFGGHHHGGGGGVLNSCLGTGMLLKV